jgi:large subunit ribosomal protein L15
MPHKLRKTRKTRGSRTVGWGRIGQHRKTGQKGGRKVGRRKHLWSWVLRYEPDYFDKHGFYSPQATEARVINVGELEELEAKLQSQKKITQQQGLPFLDLIDLGYDKLLGSGRIEKPYSIEVMSYSKTAARKIEEAGGRLKSLSQGGNGSTEEPMERHTKERKT